MAKCRLWVYNAENFFVASGHPFAPVIRPTKRNSKKVYFWDTLMYSIYIYKQVYSEKITRIVEDISGLNLLEVNIFSSSKAHFHSHCNTTRWQIWTVCWSRSWTFPTPRSWWPGLRLQPLLQLLLLRCLFCQNFFCSAFHQSFNALA